MISPSPAPPISISPYPLDLVVVPGSAARDVVEGQPLLMPLSRSYSAVILGVVCFTGKVRDGHPAAAQRDELSILVQIACRS